MLAQNRERTTTKSSRVRPLSKYEIKAGWDIPAVLEQALNSDLPGEIRALVRENVYDTASGNYLLDSSGSRLVGVYDSRIAYAQDAVTVVWNRVIFPDGSSIDLEGWRDRTHKDGRAPPGRRQSLSSSARFRRPDERLQCGLSPLAVQSRRSALGIRRRGRRPEVPSGPNSRG